MVGGGLLSTDFDEIVARAVGFEPTTNRLTADCSTAELRPISAVRRVSSGTRGRGQQAHRTLLAQSRNVPSPRNENVPFVVALRVFALRERWPRFGELIQIDDGSQGWLKDRGPRRTLIVFIDDATGRLTALHFAPTKTRRAASAAAVAWPDHRPGRRGAAGTVIGRARACRGSGLGEAQSLSAFVAKMIFQLDSPLRMTLAVSARNRFLCAASVLLM